MATTGKRRGGPVPRWGDREQVSVKWPVAHRRLYEQRAAERGICFGEYVLRSMARAHGLPLPDDVGPDDAFGGQLQLGA